MPGYARLILCQCPATSEPLAAAPSLRTLLDSQQISIFRPGMTNPVAKVITGGGDRWVDIPHEVRKTAWPVVALTHAEKFLDI